jgi:type I restriction enzyme M protein
LSAKILWGFGICAAHGCQFKLSWKVGGGVTARDFVSGGAEAKIREGMLKDDLIEAVIGLAPNLFYGTGIPACVLIINKEKEAARRGKVLFVNGAEEMVEGKNQNTLSKDNVERLAKAFVAFEDELRFARVVELEEIKKNDFNLNIARYVQTAEEEEQIDVAAEVMAFKGVVGEAG